MNDNNATQPGDPPKAWSPMQPPVASAGHLIKRIALIAAGLAFTAFLFFSSFLMFQAGRDTIREDAANSGLAHRSFDPANPPVVVDPQEAITAHLQRVAGAEALPDNVRRAMDDMMTQTRRGLPQRVDDITTRVGASSQGRHVVLDERVVLAQRIDNIAAWRENVVKKLTPRLVAEICDPGNVSIAQFMQQYNVTLWHAYSMNDGNPPLFIEVPPQHCGW